MSTNLEREYHALHHGAVAIDRSDRGRMSFLGQKRAEVLNGLLTNDVATLEPGQGRYALALTPKGRVIADVVVLSCEDSFLVEVPQRAWAGWTAMIKKFVNPRLSAYRDDSLTLRDLGVFGAEAHHVVATITGLSAAAVGALPPYAHAQFAEGAGRVLSVPDVTVPEATSSRRLTGFVLLVESARFDALWSDSIAAGAVKAGPDLWNVARVEAGRPEWGVDMDEGTIAQEANLDTLGAMSFTKGCYTGQEVVARIHFRGHVNRHLRGLSFAGKRAPDVGGELLDDSGAVVGEVRSVASSPHFGIIALGMVRREIANGASLTARWDGSEDTATVVPLPFSR